MCLHRCVCVCVLESARLWPYCHCVQLTPIYTHMVRNGLISLFWCCLAVYFIFDIISVRVCWIMWVHFAVIFIDMNRRKVNFFTLQIALSHIFNFFSFLFFFLQRDFCMFHTFESRGWYSSAYCLRICKSVVVCRIYLFISQTAVFPP